MRLLSNSLLFKSFEAKHYLKIGRKLSLCQICYNKSANFGPQSARRPAPDRTAPSHPYNTLFEWNSLTDFARHLVDNVVYFDGQLLAICKPWGVGTRKALANITDRNTHDLHNFYSGSPKYSISEALELVSQLLDVKSLKIVKSIDRFMSGIILLTTDDTTEQKVLKALRRSIALEAPAMTFLCATKGWPAISGKHLRERVGIKLLELDELGDRKHPIIIGAGDLTQTMRRLRVPQKDGMIVKPALAELDLIAVNRPLGVGLVEMTTNVMKWDFIACYLAYKTSFVLGDNRFSRQLRHVLGTPLSLNPKNVNFTDDREPLSQTVCRKLMVNGNDHIPVHIHHKRVVLPMYLSKKDKKDLIVETVKIPDYFEWTLKRLDLKSTE